MDPTSCLGDGLRSITINQHDDQSDLDDNGRTIDNPHLIAVIFKSESLVVLSLVQLLFLAAVLFTSGLITFLNLGVQGRRTPFLNTDRDAFLFLAGSSSDC